VVDWDEVDLHIAQQMPVPLTLLLQLIQIGFNLPVLPFWYLITQVVPDIHVFQKSTKMVGRVCVCVLYYYNRFMAPWTLSGTTWVSWYQKGKTNLDLLEQEIVSGSGIS